MRKVDEPRVNRNIRATDQEWENFRLHMGTEAWRELCGDLASGETEIVRAGHGVLQIKRKK